MAVANDGTAVVQQSFTGAGPFTWSGKTTAGTNRLGYFGFAIAAIGLIDGSPTWGGSPMTLVLNQLDPLGTKGASLWYIVNPPTGSSDVVLSALGVTSGYGGVVSLNGVDQASPIRDSTSANGSADPATATISAASGDLVIDSLLFEGGATPPSVGAGQTQRYNGDQGVWFGHGSEEDGAASVTMSWALTDALRWALVVAAIRAAGSESVSWNLRPRALRPNIFAPGIAR